MENLIAGFLAGILFAVAALDWRNPVRSSSKPPTSEPTTFTPDHIQRGKDWLKDN